MREPASEADQRAVVARVDFGGCVLLRDDGELLDATVARGLLGRTRALGNAVVVGDRVAYRDDGAAPVILEVEPRRNVFSRRAAGERPQEQVVAVNLDQLVLVASLVEPEFKPGLADRVLGQAEHAGIPARLVLNKLDRAERGMAEDILRAYMRAGHAGHLGSARTGEGMDELRHACRGRRSLFVGHSGVGKSTVVNALAPGLDLLVGQVNAKTGKGRHTTTAAWLVRPEPDFELIDTPGVRTFGMWGIGSRDLEQVYVEFRPFLGRCRFTDCRHAREPGCAILAAVGAGEISPRRLGSFLKLREELEGEESR